MDVGIHKCFFLPFSYYCNSPSYDFLCSPLGKYLPAWHLATARVQKAMLLTQAAPCVVSVTPLLLIVFVLLLLLFDIVLPSGCLDAQRILRKKTGPCGSVKKLRNSQSFSSLID